MTALACFWSVGAATDPRGAVDRMLRAQAIYAPSAPITVAEGDVGLGRRLFNLLPEDRFDHGPVVTGRWVLVADVRLDDRQSIAEALSIPPEEASRLADAGLILRALERWGEEAVDRLNGDFAFVAWDRSRDRIILARDHVGGRPLIYHRGNGFVAVASMPKGLHALPDVPRSPDLDAFTRYFALHPQREGGTFFDGIERVPPGHLCILTRTGIEVRRWWRPSREPLRLKRSEEYLDAVREALDRAVAARLRGTQDRVASHLSGGLDSSAVAATAARLLPHGSVFAFTSVPRNGEERERHFTDESHHAAAVAKLYPNMEHSLIRTAGRSPVANLGRNALLYEVPVLNLCNAVWADAIHDAVREKGISVLLTGQMGNLSFSYSGVEQLHALLRGGRLLALAREMIGLRRHGIALRGSMRIAVGQSVPARLRAAVRMSRVRQVGSNSNTLINRRAAERFRPETADSMDTFSTRLRTLEIADAGPLTKGVLGGWGIDSRDPTADRALVELCLRIPLDQYLRNGQSRALARNAFRDRLPPVIVDEFRKGRQAADWHEGVEDARSAIEEEAARIATLAPAADVMDVERLQQIIENWPTGGLAAGHFDASYRQALLRGLSGGYLLRQILGTN